jgi:hypothetical protein
MEEQKSLLLSLQSDIGFDNFFLVASHELKPVSDVSLFFPLVGASCVQEVVMLLLCRRTPSLSCYAGLLGLALATGCALAPTDQPAEETKPLFTVGGFPHHCISSVAFSPDGKRLAAAEYGGNTAYVYDASTGAAVFTIVLPNGAVSGIAFSPNGRLLALAGGGEKEQDNSMRRKQASQCFPSPRL